jgi:hypothetical protein
VNQDVVEAAQRAASARARMQRRAPMPMWTENSSEGFGPPILLRIAALSMAHWPRTATTAAAETMATPAARRVRLKHRPTRSRARRSHIAGCTPRFISLLSNVVGVSVPACWLR